MKRDSAFEAKVERFGARASVSPGSTTKLLPEEGKEDYPSEYARATVNAHTCWKNPRRMRCRICGAKMGVRI